MRRISVLTSKAVLGLGLVALSAVPVSASIAGFGDGSNYTLNGRDQDDSGNITSTSNVPTISGGVLTLTGNTTTETRSAFYNVPQNLNSFVASFVFQNINSPDSLIGAADGFSFVVQTAGLNALGGASSGLGYTIDGAPQPSSGPLIDSIHPSAAEEFYLRNGNGATQFGVNGSGTFGGATSTFPVDLADGDPILVTLTYDAPNFQLTETLTDLTTSDFYALTRSADIVDVVGTSGYVGFTGSTGGAFSQQTISNFTFTSLPEPASLSVLGLGAMAGFARRRRA